MNPNLGPQWVQPSIPGSGGARPLLPIAPKDQPTPEQAYDERFPNDDVPAWGGAGTNPLHDRSVDRLVMKSRTDWLAPAHERFPGGGGPDAFDKARPGLEETWVPTGELVSDQTGIFPAKVEHQARQLRPDAPPIQLHQITRRDGSVTNVVWNGNHRANVDQIQGRLFTPAQIVQKSHEE